MNATRASVELAMYDSLSRGECPICARQHENLSSLSCCLEGHLAQGRDDAEFMLNEVAFLMADSGDYRATCEIPNNGDWDSLRDRRNGCDAGIDAIGTFVPHLIGVHRNG